jgi:hypothetical protein
VAQNNLEEYKDLSINLRHYGGVSFTIITVYAALNAGFITVLKSLSTSLSFNQIILLKIAGLVLTGLLWFMEYSAMYLWGRFIRRASELEADLGFRQYSSLPGAPKFLWRPGAWAIHIFFFLFSVIWILI